MGIVDLHGVCYNVIAAENNPVIFVACLTGPVGCDNDNRFDPPVIRRTTEPAALVAEGAAQRPGKRKQLQERQ